MTLEEVAERAEREGHRLGIPLLRVVAAQLRADSEFHLPARVKELTEELDQVLAKLHAIYPLAQAAHDWLLTRHIDEDPSVEMNLNDGMAAPYLLDVPEDLRHGRNDTCRHALRELALRRGFAVELRFPKEDA